MLRARLVTARLRGSRRHHRRPAALVCMAAIAAQIAACQTWRPLPGTLEEQVRPEKEIPRALLVLRDGTELDLRHVVIRADSVIGFAEHDSRVAVAQGLVTRIETRQTNVGRTIGLLGGVIAVAAIVALVAVIRALGEFTAAPSPSPAAP